MSDGMTLVQNEDGAFSAYDDTYDVVIHCETEEEQKKVIERLKSTNWIPVSERLPKASGTYQVTCMDGRIYRSTYAKFQFKLKRWELTGARAY
ncbi:MAG: hypothetical protein SPJ65_01250 [Roseburia sp.]|nr:hypothetical protein [Roseburia sp.]